MGLSALLHLLALVSRRGHLLLIVVLVLRGVGVELLSGSRIIIHGRALLTVMSALLELLVSVRIAHMPAKIRIGELLALSLLRIVGLSEAVGTSDGIVLGAAERTILSAAVSVGRV